LTVVACRSTWTWRTQNFVLMQRSSATIISFQDRSLNTILGAVKVVYFIPALKVSWKSGVPLPWLVIASLVGNHRETAS
jgi:hypothetical protein